MFLLASGSIVVDTPGETGEGECILKDFFGSLSICNLFLFIFVFLNDLTYFF